MRTVKILAAVVGGIIALIALCLIAVWLFVNPNDYKGKIEAQVKESTGREMVLTGDIKLSVFPWIALELGPASLGNPPGFGTEPFLAFNRASVRVALLPLLSKRLEIGRIELDGLDLRLRKNAQGVGNWENFGKNAKTETPEKESGGPLPELAGILVTHGRVSYPGIVVENIDLQTGALGGSGQTPISLSFDANRGIAGEQLSFNGKMTLTADAAAKDFTIAALNLSGQLAQPNDGRPTHWEFTAPQVHLSLDAQTAAVPSFAMSYSSAHLTGKLSATKIIDALSMTGQVSLAPLVLREFAPRVGVTLPKTKDPRALAQFSASSDFAYDANGVRFEQVLIVLDDTHLKGNLALTGTPRAAKFDLTVDSMNLDRYLAGDNAAPEAKPQPPKSAAGAPAEKPMEAEGTFSMGAVHFSTLDFTSVRLTLASKGGVVHVFPVQALVDGGRYSGDITADLRGAVPALSIDEHLSGVDMAKLVANTSYKGRVSGHGNVNIKATAHGAAAPPILASLNGHFDAALAQGALEGVDLGYEIGAAQALVHRQAPQGANTHRTAFDAFKMSAEILNGVAKTTDLTISSPVLKVKGQGSANLPTKAIDFSLVASLMKSATTTAADIPLKITGTYVDPTVRPDVSGLAKDAVKQKLQDVLKKNGLDSLFHK